MESEAQIPWWCSIDIRICHPTLDPADVSNRLNAVPAIAQNPGESRVPFGDCRSAGYWCIVHRVDYPERPDSVLIWADQFVLERRLEFDRMIKDEYDVNTYVGIHTNVLSLGFVIPETPTLWGLSIPVGVEFFSP